MFAFLLAQLGTKPAQLFGWTALEWQEAAALFEEPFGAVAERMLRATMRWMRSLGYQDVRMPEP